MSVIGRMDKQVDDVLISPLARKPEPNQDAQVGDEKIILPDKQRSAREAPPAQARRTKKDELPVWLL